MPFLFRGFFFCWFHPARTLSYFSWIGKRGERSGGAEQKNKLGPPAVPNGTSALPFFFWSCLQAHTVAVLAIPVWGFHATNTQFYLISG